MLNYLEMKDIVRVKVGPPDWVDDYPASSWS
ncbi:hypothetical protein LMG32289_01201 [Cupriavidus pampae]|uniref:Uncharacterized protein n=1 Tax=Cupriavidus pampae TaxID=659251 RepID=A0ABN7Y2S7_9BURK|nr:hypothetical protein LMG32289_01201 [Cupriavidus pampae]